MESKSTGSQQNEEERRCFILLSSARSGSTLLMDLMNNHPNVKCLHEPLNRERLDERQLTNASKEDILNYVRSAVMEVDRPVVGMKLFVEHLEENHLEFRDIVRILDKPKVITLYRPNLLDTYVSLMIAYANDRWYSTNEANAEAIELDWDGFRGYATKWRQLWETTMAEVKHLIRPVDRTVVTYDELCGQKNDVTQRMFRFLGLWEIDYGIQYYSVKQNPTSLEKKITNFAEVSKHLVYDRDLITLSL